MSKSKIVTLDSLSLSNILNEDSELIPLMTPEDEEIINKEDIPEILSILPLRNTVLFPGVVIPISAGRDKSIQLINDANKGDKVIGVVAQKDGDIENPTSEDIYKTGVVAQILRVLKMPDGNTMVVIQGKKRFEIGDFVQTEPYIKASAKEMVEEYPDVKDTEFLAIIESIRDLSLKIIKENDGRIQKKVLAEIAEERKILNINAREENHSQARFASLDKKLIQPLMHTWNFVEEEKIGKTRQSTGQEKVERPEEVPGL